MSLSAIDLRYGHRILKVLVPDANLQAIVVPKQSERPVDEASLLREALAKPIGTPRLCEIALPGQQVLVVTSDLTRPCPSDRLLPPILAELAAAGIPDKDIRVVMALGLHRPMAEAELEAAVGTDVYRKVRVLNHDPGDCVRLGTTSAGTPVELFRPLLEADLLVCLGNLELHYFAGYSGGAKAILPGCASRTTISANHAMMVRPEAVAGQIEGNPVRADLEEGSGLLKVDFILNVVVEGARHRVVAAVAGDVIAAHRRGCELVAERSLARIDRRADIVLASAGGYPKDLNLYQAQKALDSAACAVRDGGIVILVAECPEGLGNHTFEAWMRADAPPGMSSADWLLTRIQQEFVLGGHKAAAIAAVQKRATIYLVSALPEEVVRRCGMIPFDLPGDALNAALNALGGNAGLLVLPEAGSILPKANG